MSASAARRERQVYRASGGRLLLGVCGAGAIAIFIDILVRADVAALMLLAPWVLLALWGVYVVAVASRVEVDPSGVRVQNLLRCTFVPWSRVTRIAMRWLIVLTMDDGTVLTCFAGPARTRPRRLGPYGQREEAAEELDVLATLRRMRGESTAPADAAIRRSWDKPAVIVLLALCLWCSAAVLIAYAG